MFFRHHKSRAVSFSNRLDALRSAGFQVTAEGQRYVVARSGVAAVIEPGPGGEPRVVKRAGPMLRGQIATLVDGGFQKFFETPDHLRKPALASDLRGVHLFQEDLREALGLTSLYNESLGTTSTEYLYDRVEDRDTAIPKTRWQVRVE